MSRARLALTVPELVLAMAITSLIGLSIAGATMALSGACAHIDQSYENSQAANLALGRVHRIVRQSRLITACDDSSMILWRCDENEDGVINISELELVEYDAAGRLLLSRSISLSNLSEPVRQAMDAEKSLQWSTDASNVRRAIDSSVYRSAQALAENVTAFRVSVSPQCPLARTANFEIVVGEGDYQARAFNASTLRASRTADISTDDDGQHILTVSAEATP
jgi:Tfp pilus assembly protein FimT